MKSEGYLHGMKYFLCGQVDEVDMNMKVVQILPRLLFYQIAIQEQ
jgi:hypothetical protein